MPCTSHGPGCPFTGPGAEASSAAPPGGGRQAAPRAGACASSLVSRPRLACHGDKAWRLLRGGVPLLLPPPAGQGLRSGPSWH